MAKTRRAHYLVESRPSAEYTIHDITHHKQLMARHVIIYFMPRISFHESSLQEYIMLLEEKQKSM